MYVVLVPALASLSHSLPSLYIILYTSLWCILIAASSARAGSGFSRPRRAPRPNPESLRSFKPITTMMNERSRLKALAVGLGEDVVPVSGRESVFKVSI